jgi:hypothetical protein
MINVFNNKCLRRIMELRWQDHVSKEKLLKQAKCKPLSNEIKKRRWKMIGHILRQDKSSLLNVALTWAPEGKRKRGRPKTTWRRMEAGWRSWNVARVVAADRRLWRESAEALCATARREGVR